MASSCNPSPDAYAGSSLFFWRCNPQFCMICMFAVVFYAGVGFQACVYALGIRHGRARAAQTDKASITWHVLIAMPSTTLYSCFRRYIGLALFLSVCAPGRRQLLAEARVPQGALALKGPHPCQ